MDWEEHPPECACYLRIFLVRPVLGGSAVPKESRLSFAQIGNVGKLKQLLEKDFERWTDSRDTELSGLTPLHYASRNGRTECVKMLLEKKYKCDVNARTKSGNATALMRASAVGEEEIVDMLLKAGADASLRDDDGETALHKAHKFIKQERRRRHEEKNRWFRRENRSGNENPRKL